MLALHNELSNQVIFSTTLKMEKPGKYGTRIDIILDIRIIIQVAVNNFCELLNSLSVNTG